MPLTARHALFYQARLAASVLAAGALLAACGGGGDTTAATSPAPAASTAPAAGAPAVTTPDIATTIATTAPAASDTTAPATGTAVTASTFTALSWPTQQAVTRYTLADGTLVTQVGGRTRDRHAREQPDTPGAGDNYLLFAPHYFERRSQAITIYENVSPTDATARILTVVVRPQWWLYGTNFRHSYIGRNPPDPVGPASVALYGDNGGMKRLPAGALLAGQELKTPIANYDALPGDPGANYTVDLTVPPKDGEFVLVKQITVSAALKRVLRPGDLLEFELGIFLAGDQSDPNLGRFNYYSEALVYQVGQQGVKPWYRGPCCDSTLIPWNANVLPDAALSGGAMMTLQEDSSFMPENTLMQAGSNIAGINIQPFLEGRRLFHTSFLTGSHSEAGNPVFTAQAGKAGPMFQQPACIACHVNNGKSSPVLGQPLNTMVVLTGDTDSTGKLVLDGRFGGHLAQGLIKDAGVTYDGRQGTLTIGSYTQTAGTYPDGTAYTLQTPQYVLHDTTGAAAALPARMSVRAAPHLVGLGLLEAVPESTLAAMAAASATDPDGAIGKLQIVADPLNPAIQRVGRFGWRGTTSTILQQAASAANSDMGVTSTMYPTHFCGLATTGTACRAADAKGPELSDSDIALIVRYTSLLAVPSQRHFPGQQPLGKTGAVVVAQTPAQNAADLAAENVMQARVVRGGQLFNTARCVACHTAALTTGSGHQFAELRNQTIRPYTDLLLHDMGADLGDNYPQGLASGQEWRTAPLWGIGLLKAINANTRYLHDGRAASIEEAILWHGGQGAKSRDRFKALAADDRQQMIDFINSL